MKHVFIWLLALLVMTGCAKKTVLPEGEIPITTSSDEALQLFLKGRELTENLKNPQAAILFDQAIALDPDFAKAYLYRSGTGGGYTVYRVNLDKAVALVDKVSEGEKHEILYALATADNDGQAQKAALMKMLDLFPEDKRVHDTAGNYYYFIAQMYEKALEHYQKAVALDPAFAPAYNTMGYLLKDMERFTEAETAFQKYIELIPDQANPYDSYAEFLLEQGRFDESIVQYQKAYDTDPEFIMALAGLGTNYVFKGDFAKAREYFQQYFDKAFNMNQKMAALYSKAVSYVHETDIDQAVATLDERAALATEMNSPNYVVNSNRNAIYALTENGRFEEAAGVLNKTDEFIKTAELNEADRKTYSLIAGLDRCYHNVMTGDLETAEEGLDMWRQKIDQRQYPTEYQFMNLVYGMLETKKKNYDPAMEYYAKANKEDPYGWFWQAVTLEQSGRNDEARNMYHKVATCYRYGMGLACILEQAQMKAK